MNEKLNKPMSVIRQEFIEKLVDDINNCSLPLFIVESVLQSTLETVKIAAQEQYKVEKAQYEQMLLKYNESSSKE